MAEVQLERLVGDATESAVAWQRLWRVLEPALWAMVDRPRFASHLAHTEDSRRRIIAAIQSRLAAELSCYLSARRLNRRLSFSRWLHAFAKRIAMGYARRDERMSSVRRPGARRLAR